MSALDYRNRRAFQIENDSLRVTVTGEGGHIAEILHKPTGVNPLWTPPWPSVEPSVYERARHPEYGDDSDAQLLAGILGHNLCLDTFGAPSPEEAAAGIPVHGEASVAAYHVSVAPGNLTLTTELSKAQLHLQRRILLAPGSMAIRISEIVENLSATDRPIAWTQHVTLGPPFLERGGTEFRLPATRSQVIDADFTGGKGRQKQGAEFFWPYCPTSDSAIIDLRTFSSDQVSGGFTTHLMDPTREQAFFLAWSPVSKVLIGYVWKRSDFPWLARWEENHLRTRPPWNGETLTCGMEFGVSPFVGSRREMVERGSLFGVPGFRWVPARTRLTVDYCAFITTASSIPGSVAWNGAEELAFAH